MAGSRDVSTTGHAGDKSFPWYWDVGARGAINRSDGPDGFRLAVREEIKQGAEIIKMFVTGGHGTVAPSEQIEMTREEITAGIEAAHQRGALVRGHIANREAIHMALDAGIDVIDHGDGLDALAIERMVELGTFLVPSQLFPFRFAEMMGGGGSASPPPWPRTSSRRSPCCPRPTRPGSSSCAATTTARSACPTAATPTSSSST